MSYLAAKLITNAYYTSGIVARTLENVSGDQMSDGLFLLNDLLADKASELELLPYFSYYTFNTIAGQEAYFINNLLFIDTLTFNIDVARFGIEQTSRREYFGTSRVDNVQAIPCKWRLERGKGGATIYFYFIPSQAYPIKLWGKFGLSNVTENQDMSLTYDEFYLVYLRYALSESICEWNGIAMPDETLRKLYQIKKKLKLISPSDLTLTRMSTLRKAPGLNWGDVNIGHGYRPIG